MHTYEKKDYGFITAIYWVVVGMTTVGYGDIYFNSEIGRLFSIIVILSGVAMIFGYLFPLIFTPQLEKILKKEHPSKVQKFVDIISLLKLLLLNLMNTIFLLWSLMKMKKT